MIFSLIILLSNSFLLHADPPRAPSEAERIERECTPRMQQGVDHFAACVADKTREAEAERRRVAETRRMIEINEGPSDPDPEPIPVRTCNPDAALRSCIDASSSAARANNPSSTDQEISQAIRSCRTACNPHLSGCTNVTSLKQTMLQNMNNCGVGTTAQAEDESYFGAIKGSVSKLADSATSYGSQAWNWLSNEATSRSSQAFPFPNAGGSAAMGLRTTESTEKDPLGQSQDTNLTNGPTTNAEFPATTPQLRFGDEVAAAPGAEPEYSLGSTGGSAGEPAPGQNPPPAGGGNGGGNTGGNTNGSTPGTSVAGNGGDQQVVSPINEPVSYQAGNFAGLQSAMSSPAGGGGIASSSSSGGGVSRGGSSGGGSYSGSSANPNSRPLAFEGSGQVSPSTLRGADAPAVPGVGGSRPAMDVAAPGGGSRGGGFGDFGGGGRMMASSRPTGPASLESSMNTVMRSDSYYRASGGRGGVAAARAAATRGGAPCKGPNCLRKARAGIAAANCDGNPQCLLALTGKLQAPRRHADEEVWEADSSGIRRVRAHAGERGIASVQRSTEPGGVVRGKIQDVLNHLGSSDVFKVDHDGMLEVDL